jgi:hypothetical protein
MHMYHYMFSGYTDYMFSPLRHTRLDKDFTVEVSCEIAISTRLSQTTLFVPFIRFLAIRLLVTIF